MNDDKALVRDYTGPKVGYYAEIYVWTRNGDRIAAVPLTARQAIDMGLELIVRGLRALK